jgi:hypothetical protein
LPVVRKPFRPRETATAKIAAPVVNPPQSSVSLSLFSCLDSSFWTPLGSLSLDLSSVDKIEIGAIGMGSMAGM